MMTLHVHGDSQDLLFDWIENLKLYHCSKPLQSCLEFCTSWYGYNILGFEIWNVCALVLAVKNSWTIEVEIFM